MFGGKVGIVELIVILLILCLPWTVRRWFRWFTRRPSVSVLLLLAGLATVSRAQVTVVQAPVPKFRSFVASGAPNAQGCVYTYATGTSTPQATYTDSTGATPNTNPVVLDANGEASIWITSAVYRFQVWTFGGGSIGVNCGGGSQLYSIDGVKDYGLGGAITSLAALVTVLTATNQPAIATVNPTGAGHIYNIPDPGTGGNFIINPSGNGGISNTLDCSLSGITCKRTASFYFRGGQCNSATAAAGWDTIAGISTAIPFCQTGSNVQKGTLGLGSAYTRYQTNTGTSAGATTVTTTYPAALIGGTGDLLVVTLLFNGTTTVSGCTDGTNAYTQAKHIANGTMSVDIWYKLDATTKAAGTTLTCTMGTATASMRWAEYLAPNSVTFDVAASNTGTGTSATTGTTASTAQTTELVIAAAGNISTATLVNSASGYVDHGQVASAAMINDDSGTITQAIAGQSASFTVGSSVAWAAAIATFKAANGSDTQAQQTITLPAFYNSAQAVNAVLKWIVSPAPQGTSNAVLAGSLLCIADGDTDDAAFNAATSATTAITNTGPNLPISTTLSALAQGGCAAGQTLHFKVSRSRYNASDTYEGFVQLIGAQLQIGITQ